MSESTFYSAGDIVIFDSIESNLGGFYNADSSVFVCPNNGMYVFALSAGCASQVNADIMLDGESLVTVRCHNSHYSQGNVMAVTECVSAQRVWAQVTREGTLAGNSSERYTAFSGFQSFIYWLLFFHLTWMFEINRTILNSVSLCFSLRQHFCTV